MPIWPRRESHLDAAVSSVPLSRAQPPLSPLRQDHHRLFGEGDLTLTLLV